MSESLFDTALEIDDRAGLNLRVDAPRPGHH